MNRRNFVKLLGLSILGAASYPLLKNVSKRPANHLTGIIHNKYFEINGAIILYGKCHISNCHFRLHNCEGATIICDDTEGASFINNYVEYVN
jgi:hypothetical protein